MDGCGPSGDRDEGNGLAADLPEWERDRLAKAERLRALGWEPYARSFEPRTRLGEITEAHAGPEAGTKDEAARYRVAGRVMSRREHGKAVFMTLRDGWDDLQIYANVDALGEASFAVFTDLDVGDIIGCEGHVFRTRRGELTLFAEDWTLLTKSLRPLPEKWHGLQDRETRYRQRYVDLVANPEVALQLSTRGKLVTAMRRYLENLGFVEVETPILQPLPGGALARPFVTHHNALDTDLYLRIAPELYLKRLLVGGFDRIFEIGKNFRNEGISLIHNPEFTMMELYWAYVDYNAIMDLVENMIPALAEEVMGTTRIAMGEGIIELRPPWPRRTVDSLLSDSLGVSLAEARTDLQSAKRALRERGVEVDDLDTFASLADKALKSVVWPTLIQPTFAVDYPLELSPLAKCREDCPELVERFQPVIGGKEMGNAFSELNDPMDQRRRFEEQARCKDAGDEEAHALDADFLRALEYGMPPAGGLGLGIDRLAMMLLGLDSLRDVILFPQLRPER
ncbi:MAG: lysine--tRNA ligase [Acidobacteria bacterium RBG_16_64_8]|nr:MAG: lysine--tRNA ligase [Acidobacteria bacterium RBG_16_64_8]